MKGAKNAQNLEAHVVLGSILRIYTESGKRYIIVRQVMHCNVL